MLKNTPATHEEIDMYRRDFLKYSAVLGVASALPLWSRFALAADRPTLPLPNLLVPDTQSRIRLTVQAGQTLFNGKAATTWGYNGNLLGPAIQLRRGKAVTVNIQNTLAEETTLHWHGLEVPGEVDGGPQGVIKPGETRTVSFTPQQPAATCWLHPHQHGKTGHQVAMGLAGLVLIEDNDSRKLRLPQQWGIDDVPLIIQDKRFTADGQIDYQLNMMSAAMGWFGDTLLCNGALYPQHTAPRGWLRLRLLNGCNARSLNIAASDGRPLYVVGSDGGLLAEPVKVTELPMIMGERFEVLVETRDGKPFDIVTLPVKRTGMTVAPFDKTVPVVRIQPLRVTASGELPDKLVDMPALPKSTRTKERRLQLMMDPMLDMMGMHQGMGCGTMDNSGMGHQNMDFHYANKINGLAFDMTKPSFAVERGQYERWIITGEGDMMMHPFHIHGTQFRILSENGKPPAAHRAGWKDTVWVEGARSEVLVRFDHPASAEQAYMAHCHLLEHEDTGMMLGFTVA